MTKKTKNRATWAKLPNQLEVGRLKLPAVLLKLETGKVKTVAENECRICLNGPADGDKRRLISPCWCKGTMKWVHPDCHESCLDFRGCYSRCRICGKEPAWHWYEFFRLDQETLECLSLIGMVVLFLVLLTLVETFLWWCMLKPKNLFSASDWDIRCGECVPSLSDLLMEGASAEQRRTSCHSHGEVEL